MRSYGLFTILLLILVARMISLGGVDKSLLNQSEQEFFTATRTSIQKKVENFLPETQAALLTGILLGIKSNLPQDFKKSLRNTSTIHIVVVSGQNLTMLAGFIMHLAAFFGRKKTVLLTVFICIFYSLITGLQIPIIRAAVMFSVASFGQLINRQNYSSRILMLTALTMLIYEPNWLISVSFQLSFLATVGVLIVTPEIAKFFRGWPGIFKQDFLSSIVVQIITFPIIAANFYQVGWIGIIVNTLILWIIPYIMISGFVALLFLFIWEPLGRLVLFVPSILLTYFIYLVSLFDQRWGVVFIRKTSQILWVGYYILVVDIYWKFKRMVKGDKYKEY